MIRFAHIRHPDTQHKDNKINPRGGATVAYQEGVKVDTIEYAVAYCNPKDNYCKEYGRMKAQGRLNSVDQCFVFTGDRKKFLKLLYTNTSYILN